jgi:hypothetical protein
MTDGIMLGAARAIIHDNAVHPDADVLAACAAILHHTRSTRIERERAADLAHLIAGEARREGCRPRGHLQSYGGA